MFYGDTVQDTRQLFFNSWDKYRKKLPLSFLEEEIAQVILAHPEYQKDLEHPEHFQDHTYFPELGDTNPFLHMGLHLAIREQIGTNRPTGIKSIYDQLILKFKNPLDVEHLIMDQLAECLWLAQKNNAPPDEIHYLNQLQQLLSQ